MSRAGRGRPSGLAPRKPARRGWFRSASLLVCVVIGTALALTASSGPAPEPAPRLDQPALDQLGLDQPSLHQPAPEQPALGWLPGGCEGDCDRASAASPSPAPAGPPTRIRISRIGVDASLAVLGLDRTGALVPPTDYTHAGWYGGGPAPGDTGPAVIAGHLDSKTGPAVFARLPELRPGDRVEVLRGLDWLPFRVVATRRDAKDRFPTAAVYDPTPGPELRLVTCGGSFDQRDRHYRDNVVVFAVTERPVEIMPRSAAG
jgi:hypothetical protein